MRSFNPPSRNSSPVRVGMDSKESSASADFRRRGKTDSAGVSPRSSKDLIPPQKSPNFRSGMNAVLLREGAHYIIGLLRENRNRERKRAAAFRPWGAPLFILAMIFLFVPSVAAAGTAGGAPGANEKIRVIASILPQAEFIEKVGAGRADLDIMVPKGMDPHTYEPVPSQLKKAAAAVLYFKLGSGVEFELAWMDRITSLNKDLAVVDTSRGAELIEGDPHAWLSPKNAAIMVNNIRDAFIMKDPAHKDIYEENAEKYIKELSALDAEIAHKLAGRRNRVFMVFHPAWSYFARDYNLREIAIQAEGKEPTIKGMKKALDEARANNVKVILVSPQFSRQSAETAAKEINGTVALADPLARDYADNVRRVADILAEEAD